MDYASGFIENRRGQRLFYVLEGSARASSAWVFCNPFFEEKLFTHRVYRNFARTLAGFGHAVLRFDYEGDGDSEGDVASIGLGERLADVEDVCAFLRRGAQDRSIGLFGLRLGGSVALLSAAAVRAREVIAWSPSSHGEHAFHELLRFNLTTQLGAYRKIVRKAADLVTEWEKGGTVPVLGHDIGSRMAFDIRGLKVETAPAPGCPCRVLLFNEQPSGLPASWGAEERVVPVQPFWHEPVKHDPYQRELVKASLALAGLRGGEAV